MTTWAEVDGNNTLAITYPLDASSMVIDLGGYHGVWASQIIAKYNPYMVLVEPVPEFYDYLKAKFQDNPKVTVFNYGVSAYRHNSILYLRADGTSKYIKTDRNIPVQFVTIQDILHNINETSIDLMQINIEGEEYLLLEQMLDDASILQFEFLQIQYHGGVDDYAERRLKIQERMSEWYTKNYDYPFVFEGWERKA